MHKEQFDSYMDHLIETRGYRVAARAATQLAGEALNMAASLYMARLSETDLAYELWSLAVIADPKNAVAQNNLACVLLKKGDYNRALCHVNKAIEHSETPQESCYFTKGDILIRLGKYTEAAAALEKTLEINPDSSTTHIQLGNLYLAMHRFREGLTHDEWRFTAGRSRKFRQRFTGIDWDGKCSLEGKMVALFNEQGVGDAIQYARYIPKLKSLGCRLVGEFQDELISVFENTGWFEEIHRQDMNEPSTVPQHDYAISIGSLPYHFDLDLDNIPVEPYLKIKGDALGKKVKEYDGFKVGIIWAGSKWHKNDKNRSCFLKCFKPLSEIPGVKLFSLQKGEMIRTWMDEGAHILDGSPDYQNVNLAEGADFEMVDLSEMIKDFNDTGQALEALDLLICVDTSALHLAGSLGRPAWVLLPNYYEWRWQKNWYPSVKVWFQPQLGDWEGLIAQVAEELRTKV